MNISGKIRISAKWVGNAYSKTEFDLTVVNTAKGGQLAKGMLQWCDVVRGKNGAKDIFNTTTKRFTCFDSETNQFLEENVGKSIEIEGKFQGGSYTDKEGLKKKTEEFIINKAWLPEVVLAKASQNDDNYFF